MENLSNSLKVNAGGNMHDLEAALLESPTW